MKELLDAILRTLEAGDEAMLLTVLEKNGSAPRGAGASMLVTAYGASGTIGGGSAEFAAQQRALALLQEKGTAVETYRMLPNEIADLGMICGGTVEVLFQYLAASEETLACFRTLSEAANARRNAWLARTVQHGAVARMEIASGCPGGGRTPERIKTDAGFVFYEPVSLAGSVYVFGGGHVSQKLVPELARVGFPVCVFEDRPEFADKALFPDADAVYLGRFTEITDRIAIAPDDYAVVMTRGHQADYEVLTQVLKTEATYIGCIGSRRKVAVTRERLLADGFSEAEFARVHTPIGLPILAETPEEIAVSIAAELILHRAKKKEKRL